EHKDAAAVHRAPAGDDAVAGDLTLVHAEIAGTMLDEHVELLERVLVHEELDALARGQLAAGVLRFNAAGAAATARAVAPLVELVEDILHVVPRFLSFGVSIPRLHAPVPMFPSTMIRIVPIHRSVSLRGDGAARRASSFHRHHRA